MHEEYSKALAGSRLLHCMVSAPFPATVLKQSKQIKVLQGITSQNTACMLHEYNIYKCQKSRGSGDLAGLWQQQELSFSYVSIKIEYVCLSVRVRVCSLCAQSIMSRCMQSKTERLELVPCQSPSKLNWGKERCQWVERRNPRKWYCKCKITQCEKCKSTVGNWAITAEDYVP